MNNTKRSILALSLIVGVTTVFSNRYHNLLDEYEIYREDIVGVVESYEVQVDSLTQEIESLKLANQDLTEQLADSKTKYKELESKLNDITKEVGFNPLDLTEISGATEVHMTLALQDTAMESLAKYFVNAEKKYNVNAYFLAGLVAQESSWGTSSRAVNDNNMTGFEVYNDSAVGASFSTKEESIMTTAKLLRNQYLTETGKYYRGRSIESVNYSYCLGTDGNPDYKWSENITSISNSLVDKSNQLTNY